MIDKYLFKEKKAAEVYPVEEIEEGEKEDDDTNTQEEKADDTETKSSEQQLQLEKDNENRRLDEKHERMEASLRKREEEVRAQKVLYEKDREKERGIHLHDKAVQHFKALLADMVCKFFK